MKRFSLIGVVFALFMSGWGGVLAAAFCPRLQGHSCCLTRMAGHSHHSMSPHDGMAMDGMEETPPPAAPVADAGASANTLSQPVEPCAHCMSHSGPVNIPASIVNMSEQSKRDAGAGPLPTARMLAQLATPSAEAGPAREHSPPGAASPRHVLISVFRI